MFKNKKIVGITVAVLLAVCLAGGTIAAYAASAANKGNGIIDEQEDTALTAEKQSKKDEISLKADGTPAAPGGRGSRLQAIGNANAVTENGDTAAQNAKGNGDVDEQEDAALLAEKQSHDEIPLDANGNPAAPGGRGSRPR